MVTLKLCTRKTTDFILHMILWFCDLVDFWPCDRVILWSCDLCTVQWTWNTAILQSIDTQFYIKFFLQLLIKLVAQCSMINSYFLLYIWTEQKNPRNYRCVHSVYSASCLGLSKFAKLARSVTRTKQTFSSTLIPSQVPVKAGLNVTEVKLVRGREGMLALSLNACTLNYTTYHMCASQIYLTFQHEILIINKKYLIVFYKIFFS